VPPTAPTPAGDGINSIIRDIREGLAQISTRELELRRREQDFGRQYRELKQAAHRAAAAEFEQTQHRVAEQIAELNAKAVELAAKRARLNAIAAPPAAQPPPRAPRAAAPRPGGRRGGPATRRAGESGR
jgi:hypothetical protein